MDLVDALVADFFFFFWERISACSQIWNIWWKNLNPDEQQMDTCGVWLTSSRCTDTVVDFFFGRCNFNDSTVRRSQRSRVDWFLLAWLLNLNILAKFGNFRGFLHLFSWRYFRNHISIKCGFLSPWCRKVVLLYYLLQ